MQRKPGLLAGALTRIEYEGSKLPENEGTLATKKLLERVREQLSKKA